MPKRTATNGRGKSGVQRDDSDSEVDAYGFIRDRLRDVGWIVKNPNRDPQGQVWTQNQCLGHSEIKRRLGAKRPENIVKISETKLWVIEAKSKRKNIDAALSEAEDYYASKINEGGPELRAVLATGVAGNEDNGYLVRTRMRTNGKWLPVTINGQEVTGFLTPKDVQALLAQGTPDIHEFAPPQRTFLQTAERINEILHMGAINKNDRAKIMAALLLSVVDEPGPNLDAPLPVLIKEVNARTENVLERNGKKDYSRFVEIIPPGPDNHFKYKQALVRTLQELRNLNIRSAMNSATDVLGQFYEVFLKYGNGAKEIGIILTPRHVTRFAVETLGLSPRDIVLDPACGTGGFLVAAFDYARREFSEQDLDRFKKHNLFGIEQEPAVAVLALVNMIFRGDGKNNIVEGNCIGTWLSARTKDGHPSAAVTRTKPKPDELCVTRVLMNPPFSLRHGVEKEYHFVTQALNTMADGGLLFSLLPMDAMFGAHEEKVWRENDLLGQNTLLAVVSFPDELFYPAAMKQVVGIIVKKGTPHPKDQPVFWGCITRDGHLKVKSKRLLASEIDPPKEEVNHIDDVLPQLRSFLVSPRSTKANIPQLSKAEPIDFADPLLELLPEAYVDSRPLTPEELASAVDDLTRETASFLIRFGKEDLARRLNAKD